MNRGRHYADFAFARRNNSRTIWPNQTRAPGLQKLPGLDHIERRNAFSNTHDQIEFSVGRFHDRVRRKWRRHEDDRRVGARLVSRFAHGVKNRPALMRAPALTGRNSADDLRAVSSAGFGVKRTFAASESLHQNARFLIY